MKIDTENIPPEGLHLALTEKEDTFQDLLDEEDSNLVSLSHVAANMVIKKEADGLFVNGDTEAEVTKRCTRCLKEFTEKMHVDIALTFLSYEKDKTAEGEHELSKRDLEFSFLTNHELDTTDIIREQIALELPISSICREDCKGLCTKCGEDLNLGQCSCPQEKEIDPRFSKLKKFKINDRRH
jgi:uncharacterized protein